MKTKFLSLMMMVVALLVATSAFAQPTSTGVATKDSYANIGDTETYAVNAAGVTTGFVWAIRNGTPHTGTTPTISSTTNSIDVDWTGTAEGDVYFLDVYYVDSQGCYSEMLTFKITITDAVLCIASSSTTVGGVSVEGPTVTETCSLIETNTSGNKVGTATGGDITDFYLTVTGGIPNASYTAFYSVDGTEQTTSVTISTNGTGAGATKVTVDFTDFATSFTNDGTGNITVNIAAERMTDSNSFEVSADAACTFPVTVHATPTLNF